MKKPRIDAAESKIMKISDLPDLESGVKIWRKALEQRDVALEVAKSNEVGYKSRMEFLEQKIEKLESKVDELRLPEHKILDLYQQKIKELESKVNIILAKVIGIIYFNYSVFTFRLLHWKKKTNLILLFFQIFIFHKKFWSKSLVIYQPGIF